jgi:PAS domain S-box-containing protein
LDPAGKITFFNEYAQKLVGYSPDEILGKDVNILFPYMESDGQNPYRMADDVLESPDDFQKNINECIRKNGERAWVFWRNKAVRDSAGNIIGNLLIANDITGHRQAEEKLRESEALYHSMFENMLDGFAYCRILFDDAGSPVDFVYLAVNNTFYTITGFENIVGKKATDAIPGIRESEPELFEIYGRVAITGKPERFEIYFSPLNKWLYVSAYQPKSGHIVAIFEDITERKEAEAVLREAQARTAAVLTGVADAFYSLDDEWRFVVVNPAAQRAPFGKSAAELLGKVIWDIYPSLVGTPTQQHYVDAVEKRSMLHHESRSLLNGRWYEVFLYPRMGGLDVYLRDIDERKKAEEALHESEETLRRAQEIAHLGSWELDLIDNRLSWSDEVYRIFGLRPQEFAATYEAFLEHVHPDDRDAVNAAYSGSLQENRDDYEIEHRVVRQDTGEIRFVNERCHHLRDQSGVITQSVGMVHDITGRKQAEALLRRNGERQEIISQTASRLLASDKPQLLVEELCTRVMNYLECDAFFNFLADEHRGKLHLNAYAGIPKEKARDIEWLDYGMAVCGCAARDACRIVAENIPGTPDVRTELVKSFGIKAYACHPLMEKDLVIGTLSFGARSRNTFSEEDLALMKDVANLVAIAMYRIRNEEALRIAHAELGTIVQERTMELKKTLTSLEDEKRRFNEVLDVLPAYVILLTPDYHVAFENRFFRERFGESNGRHCFAFLFGRSEPCEICETYKTLDHMEPQQWEWTGPDGHIYDIYDFPFIDADGSTLILEMGLDITEKKKIEGELSTHRHHLEELVERRTAQLEEANRGLESFSYSVSHDLRAPLRAIDGYSKMILRRQGDKFDAETKRQFEQVRESVRGMGQLIEDLLDFSRLGGQELNLKIFDMRELLDETWQELQSMDSDRRMTLKMNTMPSGWGDRSLMKQVCHNLFSNAIKFTRTRDTAIIEVGGNENGNENVYYIKDNGVGYDMKYHDKMFGVFQRLHSASEYEGTGIGLAIVQRIIRYHGGRVWSEGKVNEGAVFYFTLPGKRDDEND